MKKPMFPCKDCGSTTWLLTLAGYVCTACQGDSEDSNPMRVCPICHGHKPKRRELTPWTRIGPSLKCPHCDGKGEVPKIPKFPPLLDSLMKGVEEGFHG